MALLQNPILIISTVDFEKIQGPLYVVKCVVHTASYKGEAIETVGNNIIIEEYNTRRFISTFEVMFR